MTLQILPAYSDNLRIALRKETTYKTAATGAGKVFPFSGESRRLDITNTESTTITANRRSQGSVQTNRSTSGALNFNLRGMAFDEVMEGGLWATPWDTNVAGFPEGNPALVTITVAAPTEFQFAATATLPVFAADDVVAVSGANNFGHVGTYRVKTGTTPTSSLFIGIKLDGTAAFVNAAAEPLRMTKVGEYGTFTLTATGGGATATIDIGDATGAAAAVAQGWIKLRGFANASNNGLWKVNSLATTTLTIARQDTDSVFVTEAAVATAYWAIGEAIIDGATRTSFTTEKTMVVPGGNVYELYVGDVIDGLNFTANAGEPFTGSVSFVGANMSSPTTDQFSSYNAVPQVQEYNAAQDVKAVATNGAYTSLRGFSLAAVNNLRPISEVSVLGASQVAPGKFNFTGTMQAYVTDRTQLQRFILGTIISVDFAAMDGIGVGYCFQIPRIKFTSAPTNAGGANQDILSQIEWQSEEDITKGYQVRVLRYI